MRPKSGQPKRKALRRMPQFEYGLRCNPESFEYLHPNTQGEMIDDGVSVVSMFCGCGGLDLGFIGGFKYIDKIYSKNKFNILKAIDIDERCIETYRLNISQHACVDDLTTVDPKYLPPARVLIGGFPCQDFSSSGSKSGFAGERGLLYKVLKNYMIEHMPDIVVAENVPHLARLQKGHYIKVILDEFESVGYNFRVWNLFAPDYGLSQSRRRLFLVGCRSDLGGSPPPPEPEFLNNHRPIEYAIDDLIPITDESVPNQSQYFVATRATAGGGQGDHTNKKGSLAYCIRANAKARIQFHYSLDRRLTVRECARLQSFPDQFVFPFAAMSNMSQIGNAVPPILAHAVAQKIIEHVKCIDNGKRLPVPPRFDIGMGLNGNTATGVRSQQIQLKFLID